MADVIGKGMTVSIGREIREIREKQGMTERELAIQADMNEATVSNVELAASDPKISTIERIISALRADFKIVWPQEADNESPLIKTVVNSVLLPHFAKFNQKSSQAQERILDVIVHSWEPSLASILKNFSQIFIISKNSQKNLSCRIRNL